MSVTRDNEFAKRLRGFGPVGILALIIVLAGGFLLTPLSGFLVLGWTSLSQTRWREMGLVRPKSWTRTVAIGIALGVALKLLMKAVIMPVLDAPPVNGAFHYLAGNSAALPGMLFAVIVGAGFGEEMFYRSFLFERLGNLLGQSLLAKVFIILFTSGWFGLAHYAVQGVPGVEQALMIGLTCGTIFAVTGSIFLPMLVHAAFDVTAVAMIYWDVEPAFAHFFFKA
jgi:CAAX protease family protein